MHGYDSFVSSLPMFERCGCHARVRVLNKKETVDLGFQTLTEEWDLRFRTAGCPAVKVPMVKGLSLLGLQIVGSWS